MAYKVVFIDRDGTLIREPEDEQIDSLEKLELVDGVIPTLLKLKKRNYQFVMVSNQDGLGTDSFHLQDFEVPQSKMIQLLKSQGIKFRDVLVCPHREEDKCECRKPKPNLVDQYLKDREIDWESSMMIGDRITDLEFAKNIGVKGWLVNQDDPSSWENLWQQILGWNRSVNLERFTKETNIQIELTLDGQGNSDCKTGLAFFDHMLDQLARHSGVDLKVNVEGDLDVDDHHVIEDVAILLGEAFKSTLKEKNGVNRYGFALPMDECRAEALIDLSNRPFTKIVLPFTRERVGDVSTEMIEHFFQTFAISCGASFHLTVSEGNNHHIAESAFKATARALGQAVAWQNSDALPSTKGVL